MSSPTAVSPSTSSQSSSATLQKDEATAYLQSLLNKNLRVTTTDGRMFWGAFKCTDPESNLILQHTYEYRPPTLQQLTAAAAAAAASSNTTPPPPQPAGDGPAPVSETTTTTATTKTSGPSSGSAGKLKMDMTSRYLGLVVVPGQYIVKLEVEEFASQRRRGLARMTMRGARGGEEGGGEGVSVS